MRTCADRVSKVCSHINIFTVHFQVTSLMARRTIRATLRLGSPLCLSRARAQVLATAASTPSLDHSQEHTSSDGCSHLETEVAIGGSFGQCWGHTSFGGDCSGISFNGVTEVGGENVSLLCGNCPNHDDF